VFIVSNRVKGYLVRGDESAVRKGYEDEVILQLGALA
jgi:hypothetical protein